MPHTCCISHAQTIPPVRLELRCENELSGLPGLPDGWPCNQPTEYVCLHCGPRCSSCLSEFPCSTPNGKHVDDSPASSLAQVNGGRQ